MKSVRASCTGSLGSCFVSALLLTLSIDTGLKAIANKYFPQEAK